MTTLLCSVALLILAGQNSGQDEVATMWEKVKPSLIARYFESEALKGYTYKRNALVEEFGRGNAVKKTNRFESEIYYFDKGPFNKTISVNGVPLTQKQVQEQEAAFQKFKTKGPKTSRMPWARRKTPKELEERLVDLYNAFEFTIVRREMRLDRPTIVVDFKPKKNPKLKTQTAKMMFTKLEGTAWIDEQDMELAKVDLRYFKDVKIGMGILATLGDESESTREWTKVNDEIWLPLRHESRVKGRAWFFIDGFNLKVREEFSDYKKFAVDTTIKVIGSNR